MGHGGWQNNSVDGVASFQMQGVAVSSKRNNRPCKLGLSAIVVMSRYAYNTMKSLQHLFPKHGRNTWCQFPHDGRPNATGRINVDRSTAKRRAFCAHRAKTEGRRRLQNSLSPPHSLLVVVVIASVVPSRRRWNTKNIRASRLEGTGKPTPRKH